MVLMRLYKATDDYIDSLEDRAQRARSATSPASSLGQWIGSIVSSGVTAVLDDICNEDEGLRLARPKPGRKQTTLPNVRGQEREIDDILENASGEPIVLSESKWLKDARHLNDKGAWIALMSEVKQANPTVKGAISILAGPWSAGGNVEALNKVVRVIPITTEEVYNLLADFGIHIEINTERNIYKNPEEPLDKLLSLALHHATEGVNIILSMGVELVSRHKAHIKQAIDEIKQLPSNMDMVELDTIEEVAVTYKTTEGYDIREIYKNLNEAKDGIQQHLSNNTTS